MLHVLITGSSGFIGQSLVPKLLSSGFRVSELVRSLSKNVECKSDKYVLDLSDMTAVNELFVDLNPDVVIHLAAVKGKGLNCDDFNSIYSKNIIISMNVINASLSIVGIKRFIFIGSCEEYGEITPPYYESQKEFPSTSYGLSKLAITQVLLGLFVSNGFPSVVLRPSVVYGLSQSNEMFIPSLINHLLYNKEFKMTEGLQKRDFVHVNDVVSAILKTLRAGEIVNGEVINIGFGQSYKIKDIALLVANLIGPSSIDFIKFGTVKYRKNETMEYSLNVDKAKILINWEAKINMTTALKEIIRLAKRNNKIYA